MKTEKPSGQMRVCGGVPTFFTNDCESKDGYYISYNNRSNSGYGCTTTALVWEGPKNVFFILNGDHREAFGSCDSFNACLKYVKDNQESLNKWSEDVRIYDDDGTMYFTAYESIPLWYDSNTTHIYNATTGEYYILNGDHHSRTSYNSWLHVLSYINGRLHMMNKRNTVKQSQTEVENDHE